MRDHRSQTSRTLRGQVLREPTKDGPPMPDNDSFPYSNARLFAIREDRARGKALVGAIALVVVLVAAGAAFFIFLLSGEHEKVRHDAPAPESSATAATS
jgi:hypothetical protein